MYKQAHATHIGETAKRSSLFRLGQNFLVFVCLGRVEESSILIHSSEE